MPWSYGSRIYNYLCNQCLLPLMLWVRISIRARCTTLCDKVCQWLATGRWFSPGPPVSSTNKTDHHDIIEILLKVALNTIKQIGFVCLFYTDTLQEWYVVFKNNIPLFVQIQHPISPPHDIVVSDKLMNEENLGNQERERVG
jgi:hypothetical protein